MGRLPARLRAEAADTAYFHMCVAPTEMKPCVIILGTAGGRWQHDVGVLLRTRSHRASPLLHHPWRFAAQSSLTSGPGMSILPHSVSVIGSMHPFWPRAVGWRANKSRKWRLWSPRVCCTSGAALSGGELVRACGQFQRRPSAVKQAWALIDGHTSKNHAGLLGGLRAVCVASQATWMLTCWPAAMPRRRRSWRCCSRGSTRRHDRSSSTCSQPCVPLKP